MSHSIWELKYFSWSVRVCNYFHRLEPCSTYTIELLSWLGLGAPKRLLPEGGTLLWSAHQVVFGRVAARLLAYKRGRATGHSLEHGPS